MPSPRNTTRPDDGSEAGRDPLDPFPTLLSSLRPHTRPAIPTYAAVARSPTNEARPLPVVGSTSQDAGTSTQAVGVRGVWSSDDVDRVDSLDEIATFPSSPAPVFRAPSEPPALAGPSSGSGIHIQVDRIATGPAFGDIPIRRRPPIDVTQAGSVPPVGFGSVLSPASSHRPTARPAEETDTPSRPMDAAARRAMRRYAEREPRRRSQAVSELEQVLEGTWGEAMQAAARHVVEAVRDDDTNTNTEVPNRVRNPNPHPTLPRVPTQARDQPPDPATDASTNLNQIRRRLARLRADAGLGPTPQEDQDRIRERDARSNLTTRARAILAGLDDPSGEEDDSEEEDMARADRADAAEYTRRARQVVGIRENIDRLGPNAAAIQNEADRIVREYGRRSLLPATDRHPTMNNPMFTEPIAEPAVDAAAAAAEDLDIWTTTGPAARTRRVRPFYAHPNITGDIDIDSWETAFGDDSVHLRRGGNNRRRGTVTRGPLEGHLPRAHGATETRDVLPLEIREMAGLEPTNLGFIGDIVLVTSRRRERVEEDIQKRANSIKDGKRRKVANAEVQSISNHQSQRTQWPTYLNHTSLDPTTTLPRLPRDFESTSETFLRVSYSSINRPLIKFIDHPQLTGTDADASNIATLNPIPVECGVYYYEAECIDEGEEGFMSVGYKVGKRSQNRLIGWDKGTFGWHSDDGMCFEQSGSGSDFAAKWTSGDTVGVGVDFTTGKAFFTKNGTFIAYQIGHRFKNLKAGLRPAFGLRSKGEELCINFTGPFRFDIDSYVEKIRNRFEDEVKKVVVDQIPSFPLDRQLESEEMKAWNNAEPMHRDPEPPVDLAAKSSTDELPPASLLRGPVEQTSAAFVLDYLRHHGYATALESTRKEMQRREWLSSMSSSAPSSEDKITSQMTQINQQLLDTSAPVPLELIDSFVYERELLNRTAVIQFVYLIRRSQAVDGDDMEQAIAYGKMLRQESLEKGHEWNQVPIEWLNEVSGFIGLTMSDDQIAKWDENRKTLAVSLEQSIRTTHGLRPKSLLSESISRIQAINSVLAPHEPSTTFINTRRQLGLEKE